MCKLVSDLLEVSGDVVLDNANLRWMQTAAHKVNLGYVCRDGFVKTIAALSWAFQALLCSQFSNEAGVTG